MRGERDMADEVTLPENHKIPEPQELRAPDTRPETVVSAPRPQVQPQTNTALKPLQVGGNEMAEVDTSVLSSEHGAIRHDIGLAEANIRDKVGSSEARLEKGLGDNRWTIATEAAALSRQMGGEFNQMSAEIGAGRREAATGFADTRFNIAQGVGDIRKDTASGFADTRYDVATRAGDIRHELEHGFGETRFNIAERAGDIRRELAGGFDRTGDLILTTGSDVRREGAEHTNEIIKEGLKATDRLAAQSAAETTEIVKEDLKGTAHVVDTVKDVRFELASRVESNADRLERAVEIAKDQLLARSWDMGRDITDNKVQIAGLGYQVRDGFNYAEKVMELNSTKVMLDAANNTRYLSDKIGAENEKTRDLINTLKEQDLNRYLIERNAELVEERHHARHWRVNYDQAQFANLTSQLQAFQSQLAETRQGMVNFGTMAGVGQTSTANNVR